MSKLHIKKDDTVVTATVYDLDNPLITTYNIIDSRKQVEKLAFLDCFY